jgi:hypothetical protein
MVYIHPFNHQHWGVMLSFATCQIVDRLGFLGGVYPRYFDQTGIGGCQKAPPHLWGVRKHLFIEQLSGLSTGRWGYPQFRGSYPQVCTKNSLCEVLPKTINVEDLL